MILANLNDELKPGLCSGSIGLSDIKKTLRGMMHFPRTSLLPQFFGSLETRLQMIAEADLANKKSTTSSPEEVLRKFDAVRTTFHFKVPWNLRSEFCTLQDLHYWATKILADFDTTGEDLCGYEEFQNHISQHPDFLDFFSIPVQMGLGARRRHRKHLKGVAAADEGGSIDSIDFANPLGAPEPATPETLRGAPSVTADVAVLKVRDAAELAFDHFDLNLNGVLQGREYMHFLACRFSIDVGHVSIQQHLLNELLSARVEYHSTIAPH